MAWEKEYEHVDKAEAIHRIGLIDRSVVTRDGKFARHELRIRLGTGTDGQSCPHCGGEMAHTHVLHEDGHLRHQETGEPMLPREVVKQKLADLNAHHGRMEAYARQHSVSVFKGQAAETAAAGR